MIIYEEELVVCAELLLELHVILGFGVAVGSGVDDASVESGSR